MKIILASICCLLSLAAAQAQVLYSGGTYTQNFNTLSQDTYDPGSVLPPVAPSSAATWTDNSTITGWYANRDTYTTTPTLLGLSLVNQLTSAGTGSDRALGSYLGTVALLDPITYGVRIRNNTGSTLQSFTLTYSVEDFTKGVGSVVAADVLDSFNLSYSTSASDVSGSGATNYTVIDGNPNLVGVNLLNTGTDTYRIDLTINNISVANGSDLWIRWDRTGLLGVTDTAVSIDDVSFSASAVPEPATYAMIGLGLLSLFVCKRLQNRPVKKALTPESNHKVAVLLLLIGICCTGYLAAQDSFQLRTDKQNHVTIQSDGKTVTVPDKALREPYSGAWGSCTISRGVDSDGFIMIIVTMDAKSSASSFQFNGTTVKSPAGQAVVLYLNGMGAAMQMGGLNSSITEADFSTGKYVAEPIASRPNREPCKYKVQKDSAIMEDDFNWIYGDSVRNRETLVIDSANCLKMVDNYLVPMTEVPPTSIWVRNESYIPVPSGAPAPSKSETLAVNDLPLMPITRPEDLMRVLRSRDLFQNMTVDQYRKIFATMIPEMDRNSKKIRELLAKWDQGTITQDEMKIVQSAAKVVWMIRCDLLEEKLPEPDALGPRVFGQPNLTLSAEATTPFNP